VSAVAVEGLSHEYEPGRPALSRVAFEVERGEIFGLLGPNGGGKTTLFRILTTLLRPTAGRARVLGHDPVAAPADVRRGIGVVFQAESLDRKLTAAENLRHQGHLYGMRGAALRDRAAAMLARVGLAERASDRVEKLSGGMRRRVELAKGLLHEPELLLLDEPSTGLDPGGRRDLWTYLERLRGDGVTSLLTTHLMEEAERCDRLAILDRGRLVALGTPAELKAGIGGDVVTLKTSDPEGLRAAVAERFRVEVSVVDAQVRLDHEDGASLVPRLAEAFPDRIDSVSVGRPTLEDVFIARTGHRFWTETGGTH